MGVASRVILHRHQNLADKTVQQMRVKEAGHFGLFA